MIPRLCFLTLEPGTLQTVAALRRVLYGGSSPTLNRFAEVSADSFWYNTE
jgi:hypothetical protein